MDWTQLLILTATMLAIVLGIVIPLHIQNLSRMDEIHKEMKDFHGRMCKIEERRRGQ